MKRILLAAAAAFALEVAVMPAPKAAMPVIDIDSLAQMWKQVQQMQQMLQFTQQQLQTLRNVPQQLMGQAQGLLSLGVSNPLQDIMGNLQSLMNGTGTGHCTGSSQLLDVNQYAEATPLDTGGQMDFAGATMNGTAARDAGLMACTNQMMEATQQRLQQMPELLSMLQSCTDITCEQGISGRIQYEQAMIQAQTQQAILMGQNAQQQRWNAQDQILQKRRADAQQLIELSGGTGAFSGGGSSGLMSSRTTTAPMFMGR